MDLENLHPAAAFMVGRGDLQWWKEAAQGQVVDLLEAILHIRAGRLFPAIGLDRIADRLDMDCGIEDTAVVDHRIVHCLWRFFPLRLVHRLDFLADRVVVAGAGELQGVIAFRDLPAACRQDVGLGRGPDEADDLGQRIPGPLVFLDSHRGRTAK